MEQPTPDIATWKRLTTRSDCAASLQLDADYLVAANPNQAVNGAWYIICINLIYQLPYLLG